MKREEKSVDELLRDYLPVPSEEQVDSAVERVLRRSQTDIELSALRRRIQTPSLSSNRSLTVVAVAAAFLLLITAAALETLILPSRPFAVVESIDGSLFAGDGRLFEVGSPVGSADVVRTSEASGAVLALADGSRVEMRAQSELVIERAIDGVRIQLNQGSVIVSAAKQQSGHLYVQTRDVTVSVVGTVFFVNSEEEGSRVAVIEGEVRVKQGDVSKKLIPGKQIATSPTMKPRSVLEEISWSRSASAHMALLQQNTPLPQALPIGLAFDAVSVKPFLPGVGPPGAIGFACHGVDGTRRALFGNGQLTAPLGRCMGSSSVFTVFVIALAYGKLGPQYVTGGPDWIRPVPPPQMRGRSVAWFQIEGVAPNPSSATLDDLMQMLRTMLADRFRLKVHHETQESPGWSLAVAKGGLKLKEVASDVQESPYPSTVSGRVTITGKSRMEALAQLLSQVLEAPVVDRTGLTALYEYEFLVPSEERGGERGGPGPGPRGGQAGPFPDRIAELSDAMEGQLGLVLRKEKSVPVEIVVIDEIEMPSEN